jgi:hypothetical protein
VSLSRIDIHRGALTEVLASAQMKTFVGAVGREVRDRARANAAHLSSNTGAIISLLGKDADGGYFVDVGYDAFHPGFHLWWNEVGTEKVAASPHLRPAIQPRD